MQIVYERCAGLDVHKRNVVTCAITPDAQGRRCKEWHTFSTMTADLLRLRDWLKDLGVTHVAMESTGSFWKPIFNTLEGHLEAMVVNAQHLKAVPGRKTDMRDAEWIADLRASWPLATQFCAASLAARATRTDSLPRQFGGRAFTHDQSTPRSVLEDANSKLASVASDLMGKSARDMRSRLAGWRSRSGGLS